MDPADDGDASQEHAADVGVDSPWDVVDARDGDARDARTEGGAAVIQNLLACDFGSGTCDLSDWDHHSNVVWDDNKDWVGCGGRARLEVPFAKLSINKQSNCVDDDGKAWAGRSELRLDLPGEVGEGKTLYAKLVFRMPSTVEAAGGAPNLGGSIAQIQPKCGGWVPYIMLTVRSYEASFGYFSGAEKRGKSYKVKLTDKQEHVYEVMGHLSTSRSGWWKARIDGHEFFSESGRPSISDDVCETHFKTGIYGGGTENKDHTAEVWLRDVWVTIGKPGSVIW